MDYGAGVLDYRIFPKLQTFQNKAIRHILCVGKNCPVDLLQGDSEWMPVWCRHQFEMLKLWFHNPNKYPNNVTSLSPKEFQTIVITKLTDKANYKINGECESGTIIPTVHTQGVGCITIEL